MISYVPLMSTTSKGNNEFPQIKVHIEKIYVYRYYLYKRLCKLKFAIRI